MADVVFHKNGNPELLPETQGKFQKWQMIFLMFEYSRTFYGKLNNLPCSGGILDQPCKTMECLEILSISFQKNVPRFFKE